MCGHNSLFVGQVGDWTWETVATACDTEVLNATNPEGEPAYLAFSYFHVQGTPALHLRSFTFGDELDVVSAVFGFGSESILTLHEISRACEEAEKRPIVAEDFYEGARPDILRVENFNRWISRSQRDSNQALQASSPAGFRYAHLPTTPDRYSPRSVYHQGRTKGSFGDPSALGYAPVAERFTLEYRVDVSRDLNGVGLLYFASYFSIVDHALLENWRALGRTDRSFMERVVVDQKVCYYGNADIDTVLSIDVHAWHRADDPGNELFNLVLRDGCTERLIAVSEVLLLSRAPR